MKLLGLMLNAITHIREQDTEIRQLRRRVELLEAVAAAAERVAAYTYKVDFNDQEHEDACGDLKEAIAARNLAKAELWRFDLEHKENK